MALILIIMTLLFPLLNLQIIMTAIETYITLEFKVSTFVQEEFDNFQVFAKACPMQGVTPKLQVKGEVRSINDRNICERRSCMKNNGKSPTLTFVSGEARRPSKFQRLSRG